MSPVTRLLVLLLAIGGGMFYKRLNQLWGDLPPPTLDAQQWWGDEEQPKDYEAYLSNTSEVIGNRLLYPETVSEEL